MPNSEDTWTATIKNNVGDCPYCHMDFALSLVGLFSESDPEEENPEPIKTWLECRYCGWQDDE